jgi:hypothetical protein
MSSHAAQDVRTGTVRLVPTLESFYISAATRAGLLLGDLGLRPDAIDRDGTALMDYAAPR